MQHIHRVHNAHSAHTTHTTHSVHYTHSAASIRRAAYICKALIAVLFAIGSATLVFAQTGWTANAATGFAEDFPSTGEWGLSNAFPPNTVVQVTNLHTNKSTIVTIVGRKEDHSVFIILSPNAAQKIGITPRFPARVRVNPLADRSQQLDTFVETALHPDSIVNADVPSNPPSAVEPALSQQPTSEPTDPIEYVEPKPINQSIASSIVPSPSSTTSSPLSSTVAPPAIDNKTYLAPPATHRRDHVPIVPLKMGDDDDERDNNLHDLIQDTIPDVAAVVEQEPEPELDLEIIEPVTAPTPSVPAYIPSAPDVETVDQELEIIPEIAEAVPQTDIHELAAIESDSTPPQDLVFPNKLYSSDDIDISTDLASIPTIEEVANSIDNSIEDTAPAPVSSPSPTPTNTSIYLESTEPRPAVAVDLPTHDKNSIDHNQYYIQIGAFRDLIVAEDVLTQLQYQQKNVFVYTNDRINDGLNRVLVGPLSNDERGALLSWIRNQGYADAYSKQGNEL